MGQICLNLNICQPSAEYFAWWQNQKRAGVALYRSRKLRCGGQLPCVGSAIISPFSSVQGGISDYLGDCKCPVPPLQVSETHDGIGSISTVRAGKVYRAQDRQFLKESESGTYNDVDHQKPFIEGKRFNTQYHGRKTGKPMAIFCLLVKVKE